jgi:hypothetical protein
MPRSGHLVEIAPSSRHPTFPAFFLLLVRLQTTGVLWLRLAENAVCQIDDSKHQGSPLGGCPPLNDGSVAETHAMRAIIHDDPCPHRAS